VHSDYPITKPIRSAEPTLTQEPISIDEAKRQCGIAIGNSYLDNDFARWIVDARQQVEHDAEMVFYTGTFTWKISTFPFGDALIIPCVKPVTSITSITYTDSDGTTQTWSSSEYTLDTAGLVPMVKLNYGENWPQHRSDINGITVTLVAGYSSVVNMPSKFVSAVILKVRSLYLTATGGNPNNDEQAYDRQLGLCGLWSVA
jgi:uncharacterized phiE125 gp8 family phage protein